LKIKKFSVTKIHGAEQPEIESDTEQENNAECTAQVHNIEHVEHDDIASSQPSSCERAIIDILESQSDCDLLPTQKPDQVDDDEDPKSQPLTPIADQSFSPVTHKESQIESSNCQGSDTSILIHSQETSKRKIVDQLNENIEQETASKVKKSS